jgi:signal transduction histidine kinase
MDKFRILLVNGGEEVKYVLLRTFEEGHIEVDIDLYNNVDDTLEVMVSGLHSVCVIRSRVDNLETALTITADAKEAGLRIPIIVLMDLASTQHEQELINSGAIAAIPWDGTQNEMLRNVVRMAMIMQETEEKVRRSNNRLAQDLLTTQDMRERAESINIQYVELAEEYALAKDELEKLNQEKNKFFSIIAHDLKSPFTSLLGFTGILDELAGNLSSDKVKEYSSHIHESATRVFKLLENLLHWSMLQMDRVEQKPSIIDLHALAGNTLDVLGSVAQQKAIALKQDTQNLHAFANAHMVDTVIRNLVNNAIKFTPEGGMVSIDAIQEDGVIVVSVKDTGIGMDKEKISKLFKLSESVTTNGTGGETGTGLGLILCKELVERNGGQIWVESTPDHGSRFAFTLPASDEQLPLVAE